MIWGDRGGGGVEIFEFKFKHSDIKSWGTQRTGEWAETRLPQARRGTGRNTSTSSEEGKGQKHVYLKRGGEGAETRLSQARRGRGRNTSTSSEEGNG